MALNKYVLFYFLMMAVLIMDGCSSGKSAFEHGNYYEAVINAVGRLRRNADHKKSQETLIQAYPLAVKYYEDQANNTLASNQPFKWGGVVKSYTFINNMYDEITRCPGALAVVPQPVNYKNKLQEARQNAAEEYYAAGLVSLNYGGRDKAKEAYQYFKTANDYVQHYKDVSRKMEESLWAATMKVVVEPIPIVSRNVALSTEFFNDKVSEYVHSGSINQFVRFFSVKEAQSMNLRPDQIIKIEFDEFVVGQVFVKEKEMQLKKDSVELGSYVSKTKPTQGNGNNSGQGNRPGGQGNNAGGTFNNQGNANNPGNQGGQGNNAGGNSNNQGNKPSNQGQGNNNAGGNSNNQGNNAGGNSNNQGQGNQGNQPSNQGQGNSNAGGNSNTQGNNNQGNNAGGNSNSQGNQPSNQGQGNNNAGSNSNNSGNQGNNVNNTGNQQPNNQGGGTNKPVQQDSAPETGNDKVTLCHNPPGNTGKPETLVVPRSAVQAHLDHGDKLGSCDDVNNQKKGDGKGNGKGNGNGQAMVQTTPPVFVASAGQGVQAWHKYFGESLMAKADTGKVYGTVKATYRHFQKTIVSKGVVTFKIIDARTNAILTTEKMPGEYVWVSEWASFNGDERALSKEQLQMASQREATPPSPQDLFVAFTRPIYDQITNKINNFYRNY